MSFNPNTPAPFDDESISRHLGDQLGRQRWAIELQADIEQSLGVVLFRAEVLNWPELAFGSGYISRGIERTLGWPRDKITATSFFDLVHKDDMSRLDGIDLANLPTTWSTRFRISNTAGEWVLMASICKVEARLISGMMLPLPPECAQCPIR